MSEVQLREDTGVSKSRCRCRISAFRTSSSTTSTCWRSRASPSISRRKPANRVVTGKPITIIYARGGAYGPGSGAEGYDAQSTYMRQFLGFTDVKEIFVEPTLQKADAVEHGQAKAKELAEGF